LQFLPNAVAGKKIVAYEFEEPFVLDPTKFRTMFGGQVPRWARRL